MGKMRIPSTFPMGLPKEVTLSTVQMQGNHLKLGIHLQDTAGPHGLEFMVPVSYPHSLLRAAWSSGVSHSVSTLFFLCEPSSLFMGVPGTWAVTVASKEVALPSWVTHNLGSNPSFSGEGKWAVSSDASFSPWEIEESKASWSQICIVHCSKCQPRHLLHSEGSSFFYLTSLHLLSLDQPK